jgi:hypothetical protein
MPRPDAPRRSAAWSTRAGLAGVALTLIACAGDGATIVIDPATTHQTIVGWEATAQSGESVVPGFPLYAERLFDLAVDSLGINRLRVEVTSGIEYPRDRWSEWRAGAIDDDAWRCVRYATADDDGNPETIDWSHFQFSQVDATIERVVLPIKRRLEAKGERLYLNVTYVAFVKQCPNTPYHHLDLREYAEFALAVHLHLRDKYGLVPDGWEMILEPEHTDWRGRAIGEAMVLTARRLADHGFTPQFIAPSNTSMAAAVEYFDEMIQVPGVLDLLDEFSYHRYRLTSTATARAIRERRVRYGVRTAMLEHIGSGHEDLHEDLVVADIAAWQQFALAFTTTKPRDDGGGVYFLVDVTDSTRPRLRWGDRTRFLRQYFHYIRAGATRIGAASDGRGFAPAAFINADGRAVVVVNAASAGALRIVALPPGEYAVSFTTADTREELPPAMVGDGDTLRTAIPAAGVLTVFAR